MTAPMEEGRDARPWPEAVRASARRLQSAWGARRPRVAVVLGSGWSGMVQGLDDPVDVPYAELPAFPRLSIAGHAGAVRLARLPCPPRGSSDGAGSADAAGARDGVLPPRSADDLEVMLLMGRQHAYEAGDAVAMRGAVQTVAAVGCGAIVVTNAAGSLHAHWPPGSLMALSDHLNLVQRSPLQGLEGSDRFVDMSQAYDPTLRASAKAAVAAEGLVLHEGVYAWMMGPQFETPAEIRMLRTLGADAVGMSTVPEVIAARHAGLRVLAISLMTNLAAGLTPEVLSHEQTLAAGAAHEQRAAQALRAILRSMVVSP